MPNHTLSHKHTSHNRAHNKWWCRRCKCWQLWRMIWQLGRLPRAGAAAPWFPAGSRHAQDTPRTLERSRGYRWSWLGRESPLKMQRRHHLLANVVSRREKAAFIKKGYAASTEVSCSCSTLVPSRPSAVASARLSSRHVAICNTGVECIFVASPEAMQKTQPHPEQPTTTNHLPIHFEKIHMGRMC